MTDERLVLAMNAGSSSLKVELFAGGPALRSRGKAAVRDVGRERPVLQVEGRADEPVAAASHGDAAVLVLERLTSGALGETGALERIAAVGHRVVHGGEQFAAPARLTPDVRAQLARLAELAPLHNPPALAVIDAVRARLPRAPAVAVFDTAFFRDLPAAAREYAVPRDWVTRYGVQRFGFHGIAHEYLSRRLAALAAPAPRRVLTLQLGQGCSIAALADGRPVETSMGFTPLEGLIMGTRSGDLDAGIVVHLVRHGHSADELDAALNERSGLLGLSGSSDDVRELLALEARGDGAACAALAAFCHRIHKYIGAYAAVLGGVDAIAFGGGIGEHSAAIRARVCGAFGWLGLVLDPGANEASGGQARRISAPESAIGVYVIPVHEELAIARAAIEHAMEP